VDLGVDREQHPATGEGLRARTRPVQRQVERARRLPAEAEALGVAELFKAAIENGSYEPETAKAAVESVTGTAKTVGGRQFGEQSTPSTTSGQALSTSKGGAPGKKNVTEE